MKNVFLLICFIAMLSGCQSNTKKVSQSDSQNNAQNDVQNDKKEDYQLQTMKKRISQYIDVRGMGMIKDFKIDSIKKVSDTTCFARHYFHNPVLKKDIRVSKIYHFNTTIDSVKASKEILTEMKSEGEWVKSGF